MSLRIAKLALIFCCLVAASPAALAEDWQAGKQAFADGDFDTALFHFQNARDKGLDGPAVHYNIAVVQFELARYDDAGETFRLIAERFPAMRGLAEYNLGLVARRQGRRNDAASHFLRAYDLSPDDEKIRVLASRRIRELEPGFRSVTRWSGAFGLRAGHDDNIALRDEAGVPVGTTTESPMADMFASFSGPLTGRDGFRVNGSAYVIKYADADEFDQTELQVGGLYEWRRSNWRAQLGAHATTSMLGGDSFDRKLGADARFVRYVGDSSDMQIRYTYDDVSEGEDFFAAISGSRQLLEGRYRYYRDDRILRLRVIYETNDRLDSAVSPERYRVSADYRLQPEHGFGFEVGIDYRNSQYDDIAIPRNEKLLMLVGGMSYTFRNDWSVIVDYRLSDNESNDPDFTYDRQVFTLGAVKVF
jgi:hypothetical protein